MDGCWPNPPKRGLAPPAACPKTYQLCFTLLRIHKALTESTKRHSSASEYERVRMLIVQEFQRLDYRIKPQRRDCPLSIFGDFEVCGGGVERVDDGVEHVFSQDSSHSFWRITAGKMARRITSAEPFGNSLYGARHRRPTVLTYTLILRSYSTPAQQKSAHPATAYDRLRPVISTFQAPIDWAAAYGSGVLPQASYKPPAPGEAGPLTDLLIATPDAEVFHNINLAQNPGHYPVYARWMGGKGVGWVQEKWGAGVWYVTMVDMNGVVSTYCSFIVVVKSLIKGEERMSSTA